MEERLSLEQATEKLNEIFDEAGVKRLEAYELADWNIENATEKNYESGQMKYVRKHDALRRLF